jgi:glycopeptide antibiotics resistance protein
MADPSTNEVSETAAKRPRAVYGAFALYLILLLLFTLAPFDFTWRPLVDDSLRGERFEWVPLTYACPAAWYWCLYDRVVNVLGFLPFGALGALLPVRGATRTDRVLRLTGCAFGLSLSIEASQLFLPSRFPSTADVALNTLGAWLGATVVSRMRNPVATSPPRTDPWQAAG